MSGIADDWKKNQHYQNGIARVDRIISNGTDSKSFSRTQKRLITLSRRSADYRLKTIMGEEKGLDIDVLLIPLVIFLLVELVIITFKPARHDAPSRLE